MRSAANTPRPLDAPRGRDVEAPALDPAPCVFWRALVPPGAGCRAGGHERDRHRVGDPPPPLGGEFDPSVPEPVRVRGVAARTRRVYRERVASWDDVRRIALALPETGERWSHGHAAWRVRDKGFVWERPLRLSDLRALGDDAPAGAILGAHVEHLVAKEALLADDPDVFFTIPHFNGYPAVLVRLDKIALDELEELIVEAWLARAPKRLAKEYIATKLPPSDG